MIKLFAGRCTSIGLETAPLPSGECLLSCLTSAEPPGSRSGVLSEVLDALLHPSCFAVNSGDAAAAAVEHAASVKSGKEDGAASASMEVQMQQLEELVGAEERVLRAQVEEQVGRGEETGAIYWDKEEEDVANCSN